MRITLNHDGIVSQTRVTCNTGTWVVLALTNGSALEVHEPIPGIVLSHSDIREKPLVLSSTIVGYKPEIVKALDIPSVSTGLVPRGKSVPDEESIKYRGAMVWSHKTAPEIQIVSPKGKVIKDVDVSTMYKRR